MVTKELVVLANSYKPGGRCVAGIELVDSSKGEWVRPVSAHDGHGLNTAERLYSDGTEPRPLDWVIVELDRPQPLHFQTENWLVSGDTPFTRNGYIPKRDLEELCDQPRRLWVNGHSTRFGTNDFVPEDLANQSRGSLNLIKPNHVELWTRVNEYNGKHEWWADFEYAENDYCFKITDPIYRDRYRDLDGSRQVLTDAFLTISLGEAWRGNCSKLVAAIIEPEEYD